MIKMIVAVGKNNLIGCGDKLCWHIPEELKLFKELTLNSNLLMGQTTFNGLPKKLINRKFYVLGRNITEQADVSLTSLEQVEELFNEFKNSEETLWIAGGKFVYESFYKFADQIYVSYVDVETNGDVFLDIDLSGYSKQLFREEKLFKTFIYSK